MASKTIKTTPKSGLGAGRRGTFEVNEILCANIINYSIPQVTTSGDKLAIIDGRNEADDKKEYAKKEMLAEM